MHLSGAPWPSERDIDELIASGVAVAEVEPEIGLDDSDPWTTLEFLRFLRDATAKGMRVSWRARLGRGLPVAAIAHLPPPSSGSALSPAVAVWREYFRPDRFVWRKGPGFVLLMEMRAGRPPRRGRLTDADALDLFERLQAPGSCRDDEAPAAVEQLESQGVLLRLGKFALALPVHQRRPPIVYRRAMHTFESAFEAPGL